LQEYAHLHGRLGIDTLDRLSKKIIARAEKGEEIKSLREIYDLWIDCCEEAYNEFAFTEEYAEAYGRLINALMALKHQSQNTVDELMGALNMPTHKGITTLQCRQQELRRELREMRARLSEQVSKAGLQAELKALHQELKALHAELNALKTTRVEAAPVSALAPEDRVEPTARRRTPASSKAKTSKPANATGE
jgi:poly[(R)-3-hydroxyalkanoate] polymerase subunit PhaE